MAPSSGAYIAHLAPKLLAGIFGKAERLCNRNIPVIRIGSVHYLVRLAHIDCVVEQPDRYRLGEPDECLLAGCARLGPLVGDTLLFS